MKNKIFFTNEIFFLDVMPFLWWVGGLASNHPPTIRKALRLEKKCELLTRSLTNNQHEIYHQDDKDPTRATANILQGVIEKIDMDHTR